jgi:hypothetical protein
MPQLRDSVSVFVTNTHYSYTKCAQRHLKPVIVSVLPQVPVIKMYLIEIRTLNYVLLWYYKLYFPVTDLLWIVLCNYQSLPNVPNLHRQGSSDVQGKTEK